MVKVEWEVKKGLAEESRSSNPEFRRVWSGDVTWSGGPSRGDAVVYRTSSSSTAFTLGAWRLILVRRLYRVFYFSIAVQKHY